MTKVRDGLLLGKKTILKSDYLPACQNKSVNPRIEITIRLALCMFTASLCQPPLGYETFLTTSELTKPAIKFKFFGLVLGRNR
uniref:Uncharacterized protein n=1 Tax=Brassica oleracea var. oleracea TaxID=109376 RepID=A0A0D3A8E6_BRAOL